MLRRYGASLLLVPALLLAVVPAPTSATPDGVEYGARVGPRTGETNQSAVQRLEGNVGRPFDVVREFLVWDSPFPDSYHTWLRTTGRTMILSIKARRANGTTVRFADVAAAQPGSALHADIVRWADRIKAYGAPVYVAFNHEPESKASAANGEAPEFIAAWRRFHDIFVERGATNVKFIWIMTDYAFFVGSQARNDAAKWYPGDDYLDAMGADAYNWFTCRTGINTPWWSLEQIIRPFRDFGAAHPDEELWLTEYASTEDPARPGRKAAWLAEAQALFKRPDYAQFHGIVYFDFRGPDACQWYVDSSATSLAAFRTLGQDPFYGGPSTPPPTSEVSLVAQASTNGNRTSHGVTVPATVRAGDTLLLFYTANQQAPTTSVPAGWTPVRAADVDGLRGRFWTRTATAADAGATVSVDSSVIVKADLTLLAYRGTAGAAPDVHAVRVETTTGTSHTAPSVTPTRTGGRVIAYWADKSSTNTGHAVPTPLARVAGGTGSGGGRITTTVAEGAAGPAGTALGPYVAVGTGAANRAVAYTLVLAP